MADSVKVAYDSDMQLAVLAALGLDKKVDRVTCIVMTPGEIIVDTLDVDEDGNTVVAFASPDGKPKVFRNKTIYSTHVTEELDA